MIWSSIARSQTWSYVPTLMQNGDMYGHSGMVPTLGHFGFPNLNKSKKQKVVTRSSTEAELVSMYSGLDLP